MIKLHKLVIIDVSETTTHLPSPSPSPVKRPSQATPTYPRFVFLQCRPLHTQFSLSPHGGNPHVFPPRRRRCCQDRLLQRPRANLKAPVRPARAGPPSPTALLPLRPSRLAPLGRPPRPRAGGSETTRACSVNLVHLISRTQILRPRP